jgi:hypothetical protein
MPPVNLLANQLLTKENLPLLIVGALVGCLVSLLGFLLYTKSRTPRTSSQPKKPLPSIRDPFVQGGTSERRTSLRRKGTLVEVQLRDAEARADLGTGWVTDRSMGGLCVTVEGEVEPGEVFSVRAVKAPTSAPWVQLEVKSCRLKDGKWELGCQFVRQPTWNVLMLFG